MLKVLLAMGSPHRPHFEHIICCTFFGLEVNVVLIGKGGGRKHKHLGLYKSALS